MNDDFEKQIQRQSLRKIPGEWRAEIVGRASSLSSIEKMEKKETGRMPVLLLIWRDLLWPHPKAWAGLAAVWIAILALNFSTRDHSEIVAKKSAPPSPEVVAELRQEKLLFAQWFGSSDAREAEPPKFFPRPRTERVEILTA
jgi:hypothetical protein